VSPVQFNVTLISPTEYRFAYLLTDACRQAAYGLRSLGYRCDLTVNTIETTQVNVIVGAHLMKPAETKTIVDAGVRYVVVQSEWLAPGATPGRITSSFHGDRFESECRLLFERAEAVWEAYEWNAGLLRAWNILPQRIKRYGTIGYHERMRDVVHRPWAEKDIDVLFYGSTTPRRQRVLQALSRRYRTIAILDAPAEFRNDLIARAKLNLNLNADDRYTHLSLSRVGYLLNNRCAIVSESATTHPEIQALMECAPYEQLVEECAAQLAKGERLDDVASSSYERFKAIPMSEVIRRAL
jgi:hypothetical protein